MTGAKPNQGDDCMIRRFKMMLFICLLVLPVMRLHAQELPAPLAVRYQGGLYILNDIPATEAELLPVLTPISVKGGSPAYYPVWSPDGTKLAYLDGGLKVWDGTQSIALEAGYPSLISWTADGRILYMTQNGDEASPITMAQVYAIAPEAGALPEVIAAALPRDGNCYGSSLVPMDYVEMAESRISLLALTDHGLLYPGVCVGGIRLYRPYSVEIRVVPMFAPVLSFDATRVAGAANGGGMMVVNLATLEETTFPTSMYPQAVAWGGDGSLYYASRRVTADLADSLTPAQKAVLDEMALQQLMPWATMDSNIDANTVSIYRIAPDGTETLLHEQYAYAVGKLMVKDNTVLYSTIPNGDALLHATLDGQETRNTLPVSVNYLTLDDTGKVLATGTLPGDLQQFVISR
jgi:hypothetical protein